MAKKVNMVSKIRVYMWVRYVLKEFFATFPVWLKMWKVDQNSPFFQMSAILKFDFQKKTTTFFWSKVSRLHTHTKQSKFACDNYIFPKTRGNKNKQWTHSTPLKYYGYGYTICCRLLREVSVSFANERTERHDGI